MKVSVDSLGSIKELITFSKIQKIAMGYIDIKVLKVASREDLQEWEDRMLEKARCWNNFCLGVCDENEIRAVQVTKEGHSDITYLTTLCEDCIKTNASYGVLVDEKHLMVEPKKKLI